MSEGVYQHQNMRDMTAEQIKQLINQKQDQRLLVAIEAKNAREAKVSKMKDKDHAKYVKLGDKIVSRLAKVTEMLTLCDQELMQMQQLSNNLDLMEKELGVDGDEV